MNRENGGFVGVIRKYGTSGSAGTGGRVWRSREGEERSGYHVWGENNGQRKAVEQLKPVLSQRRRLTIPSTRDRV